MSTYGPASSCLRGDLTDEAFSGDLSELGWRGRFKYDDPEVVALRAALEENAGIPDIEVIDPAVAGFAQRAAFLLNRDGYCVVKDVLDSARLAKIRRGCEIAIREMVGRDPMRLSEKAVQRIKSASAGVGLHLGWQGCAPADAADALELMSTAGAYETTNCLAGCADQRMSVHLSLAAGDVPRGTRLDQRPARTTA